MEREESFGVLLLVTCLLLSSCAGTQGSLEYPIHEQRNEQTSAQHDAADALGKMQDQRAVEPLISLLKNEYDPSVRQKAARALGEIGDPKAVTQLISSLEDEDPHVSGAAATALGEIGNPKALSPLVAALKHRDLAVSDKAARALGRMGSRKAVAALVSALEDHRKSAALGLAETRDQKSVDALIAALKDKSSTSVRRSAAYALGKIKDQRAIAPLVAALHDDDYSVRRGAARALMEMGWEPTTTSEQIEFLIAREKWDELAKKGAPAVGLLIALLRDKASWTRGGAAKSLTNIGWEPTTKSERIDLLIAQQKWDELIGMGTSAFEPLIAVLNGPNLISPHLSRQFTNGAVKVLVAIGKVSTKPLIDVLQNGNKRARVYVADALGKINDHRAVKPLIVLLKDEDLYVQSSAADALRKLGWAPKTRSERIDFLVADEKWDDLAKMDPPAVEALVTTTKLRNRNIKRVVTALGRTKDRRAVDPLISLLRDEVSGVRNNAAFALGEIGDDRAVAPLIATLKDPHYFSVQPSAAHALGDIKNQMAVEPLITALKGGGSDVRVAAASALGKIGDKRAVVPLIAALKEKDVARTAARVLGKLKDQRAVEPLAVSLKAALKEGDSYTVSVIVEALWAIGSERAVGPLVKSLTDWDSNEVTAKALTSLGWKPRTDQEVVHFYVAKRNGEYLRVNWQITKKVLLADISSDSSLAIKNALQALIGIGKEEIINVLVDKLNDVGNKKMAEAYLNSRHPILAKAAKDWATRHGYVVSPGPGVSPVGWGSM